MTPEPADPVVLRVVKGSPSAEELAALTAVLLACAARRGDAADGTTRTAAPWHRLERVAGFEGARTWQSARPVRHARR
ncbi:acyl-CoA carboxylase epsilon subunit [Actinosynnema sp. CS-041913]|uniref:acyl-CoA carboxylase epsilon subunit n=1 Tax=Actinosynnema sp. CS-041913 TaxID=3239917 RepID=UPI003D927C07